MPPPRHRYEGPQCELRGEVASRAREVETARQVSRESRSVSAPEARMVQSLNRDSHLSIKANT